MAKASMPLRIQRRRSRGWRLPANTVCVSRPSRFGNRYRVGLFRGYTAANAVRDFKIWLGGDFGARVWAGVPPTRAEIRAELRGKNQACWCHLCEKHAAGKPFDVKCADCAPCHVDVLGPMANR